MRKIIILSVFLLASCSVNKIAVNKTAEIIDNGIEVILKEKNINYIKESLASNLQLMEILYQNNPNPELAKNMAMGFCGYAFAFLEDNREYANSFYRKGINYTESYIKENNLLEKKPEKFTDRDTAIMFWNTFCKSAMIDFNRDDVEILAMLNEAEVQTDILLKINPEYFYSAPETFKASIYAVKPQIAGGSTEKAKEYYEKAIKGNGKYLLLNKFMYAKNYAVLVQDEKLFDKLTDEIINTTDYPEDTNFFNQIAKIKTEKLKGEKNELF